MQFVISAWSHFYFLLLLNNKLEMKMLCRIIIIHIIFSRFSCFGWGFSAACSHFYCLFFFSLLLYLVLCLSRKATFYTMNWHTQSIVYLFVFCSNREGISPCAWLSSSFVHSFRSGNWARYFPLIDQLIIGRWALKLDAKHYVVKKRERMNTEKINKYRNVSNAQLAIDTCHLRKAMCRVRRVNEIDGMK